MDPFFLVVFGILLALAFDFANGLNDAANAVSTVIATRVLSLRAAVLLSAFFNFVAAFVFSTEVAKTIGKGIVQADAVSVVVVLACLVSAMSWTYWASFKGIPVSASHALIGGLVGAAIAANGVGVILSQGLLVIILFIFIAPVTGFVFSLLFSALVLRLSKSFSPHSANQYFKKLQLLSVSVYSLGHGTNDAQKTMGIISLLLFSGGMLGSQFNVPWWVVILSHSVIAAGTLAGGWRVIKTMGTKITHLKPIDGFSAETSGAGVIIASTMFGIPVSTTHVIAGSIMGVGVTKRIAAVRWGVARNIMVAWLLTIPVTLFFGGAVYFLMRPFLGA
ncbi:MAG: inorganic phosphate transporter [Candidatus Micrarchaeota archaeon]